MRRRIHACDMTRAQRPILRMVKETYIAGDAAEGRTDDPGIAGSWNDRFHTDSLSSDTVGEHISNTVTTH
jgi:hypothetical protein